MAGCGTRVKSAGSREAEMAQPEFKQVAAFPLPLSKEVRS